MESYKDWVRSNRQWISSFESLANTLTWFLPERFANYELTSEAVSTMLGLVTVMNQHIVETAPPAPRPVIQGGMGNDSIVHQSDRDQSFPWSLCVSVVKELEVLIEMASESYLGKDQKWAPVASVEAVKALLRLIILHKSGYRLLLDGGETKNVKDPSVSPGQLMTSEYANMRAPQEQDRFGRPGPHQSAGPRRTEREGAYPSVNHRNLEFRAMQAMHKFNENVGGSNRPSWIKQRPSAYEELRVQEQHSYIARPIHSDLKEECQSQGFIAGEILLISRPLLYVLLVWRYGLKSWRPWLSGLSFDLIGMYLVYNASQCERRMRSEELTDGQQGNICPLSTRERQELRRRQILWALYVMRNPFFNTYTRRPLERVEEIMSPVPVFGTLAGKAVELLYAVQGFYTYTAAS